MAKDKNEMGFLLRLPKDLKIKVSKKAKDNDRSLNGHIVSVLKNDIEKK